MSAPWLTLVEFSQKVGLSQTTIRRRLKDNALKCKLENGKYLIHEDQVELIQQERLNAAPPPREVKPSNAFTNTNTSSEVSVLTSAQHLVEELKAAYAKVLQEKENQITILKEEIVDLRMLVRILEEQNSQNKPAEKPSAPEYSFGNLDFK